MRHRRRGEQGYTLVEVLSALIILGTGILGIFAMQGAAVAANRRANEYTTATNIARLWQERLRRDSYQWNHPSQSSPTENYTTNTHYLRLLGAGFTATQWVKPSRTRSGAEPLESVAFDYFGNDVDVVASASSVYYCAHIRLTPVITNELVRAEVRVFWYREGGVRPADFANCGADSAMATLGQNITDVHWVYMAQTLHRHEP